MGDDAIGAAGHRARRSVRDPILGLGIVVAAFLGSLGISVVARDAAVARRPATPQEAASRLYGWPHRVDPIRALGDARALSRFDALETIVATAVKADGTVDLKVNGSVRYVLGGKRYAASVRPDAMPSKSRTQRCSRQTVRLGRDGLLAAPEREHQKCSEAEQWRLPEPACDMAQIWRLAAAEGVPTNTVARIEYRRASDGPRWKFRSEDGRHHLEISQDCTRRIERSNKRTLR